MCRLAVPSLWAAKGQMTVIFVLGKKVQPLTLADAKRMIEFNSHKKRKGEIVANAVKQLTDKAKIE